MAPAGWMGAALFMMHSSFSTAASSWMMTPPTRGGDAATVDRRPGWAGGFDRGPGNDEVRRPVAVERIDLDFRPAAIDTVG